jgi:hypothetical protein
MMRTGNGARFSFCLGCLAAGGALGCGATGLDWVGEPEVANESVDAQPRDSAMSEPLPAGAAQRGQRPEVAIDETSGEHQRLMRTVTLGGDAAPPGAAPNAAPAPERGTTIVINNYPSSPSYAYPAFYGGVSASRANVGVGRVVTATPSAASPIQPGQNWTPPAQTGPSFPFHMGPASPWETDHRR